MNRIVTLGALLLLLCIVITGLSSCGKLVVRHKWGFIDQAGLLVIPYTFDDVAVDNFGGFEDPSLSYSLPKPFRNFSEELCAVRIGDKWGYIDKTGAVVIPAQFDSAGVFSEGFACVRQGKKVGYIDKTGQLVIPCDFDWFPNWTGKDPLDQEVDSAKSMIQYFQFSEGLAAAFSGPNCGYINKSGKFVIEPKYDRCGQFKSGFGIVCKETRLSCLDGNGKVAAQLPPGTNFYGDGLFAQAIGEKQYVFIDTVGRRAFPQIFVDVHQFSEGLAAVAPATADGLSSKMGYGYIDRAGKLVIPATFYISADNTASAFVEGKAIVSKVQSFAMGDIQNLQGVIDRSGKWIVPPRYEHIGAYRDGMARAFRNNTTVYLDGNGSEVLNPRVNWGNTFSDGMAAVMEKAR